MWALLIYVNIFGMDTLTGVSYMPSKTICEQYRNVLAKDVKAENGKEIFFHCHDMTKPTRYPLTQGRKSVKP
jgi:hypothetical protein